MKNKKEITEARDTGTPELSTQRIVLPRRKAGRGYDYDLYVENGSEPDRLLLEGKINSVQHATLRSYTIILHQANMLGPKSPALERRSGGDPAFMSKRASEALAKVVIINRILDKKIGRVWRERLNDACMSDKRILEENTGDLLKAITSLADAMDEARNG